MAEPIRVVITGAAGQIGYSLVYMIASGSVFGDDQVLMWKIHGLILLWFDAWIQNIQPLILHLLDIAPALGALEGLVMELDDCAFKVVKGIVTTADPLEAFKVFWSLWE